MNASGDLLQPLQDPVLEVARRIQEMLRSQGYFSAEDASSGIKQFLQDEAGQGHFLAMTALALTAGRKDSGEQWTAGHFGSFLRRMALIRGLTFDDLIRSEFTPEEAFNPAPRAMAERFQRRFSFPSTPAALDSIQDVLTAEFSAGIYSDLLGPLFSVQVDALRGAGFHTKGAERFATDIRSHWDALTVLRPGSRCAEVWKVLFEWENAQAAAGPGKPVRKDFIIRGDYPHQWVEYLDPDRPVQSDEARPGLRRHSASRENMPSSGLPGGEPPSSRRR
jgi:hypothetical protein